MILQHSEVSALFNKYIDIVFPSDIEGVKQSSVPTGEGEKRTFFYSDHDSNFELSIQANDDQVSENILHIIFVMNDDEFHSKLIVSSDVVSDENYSRLVSNGNALAELNNALIVFKNLNIF